MLKNKILIAFVQTEYLQRAGHHKELNLQMETSDLTPLRT